MGATTRVLGAATSRPTTIRSGHARALRAGWRTVIYLLLLGGSVAYGFPFYWMIRSSLMRIDQFFEEVPPVFPIPPAWQNYAEVWRVGPMGNWIINTATVTAIGVVVGTVMSAVAAYGFARLDFPARKYLFVLVISTMMLPAHVTIVPQVILLRELGWLDTLLSLTIPLLGGSPFYIFLLRQFFMTLPRELDDAAAIDGASRLRVLWMVIVPLSKPALATVAVFAFIGHWNDFFHPFVFLNSAENLTLAVGMRWLQAGQYEAQRLHLQMAIALIAVAPLVIAFFFTQKQFIRGIALTGIKG